MKNRPKVRFGNIKLANHLVFALILFCFLNAIVEMSVNNQPGYRISLGKKRGDLMPFPQKCHPGEIPRRCYRHPGDRGRFPGENLEFRTGWISNAAVFSA